MKPLVAIVGRPNVGKSRLFNRIASKKKAIVLDLEGTTRDTIYETIEWERTLFDIVDTGGLTDEKNNIHFKINKRVKTVVGEASVVLMVCDYKTGVLPYDREIAQWLRKLNKPVLLVVNKIDSPAGLSAVDDFYQLGFKDIFGVSAEHGYGVDEVLDSATDYLKKYTAETIGEEQDISPPLKLVFAGKPNAGKSSIINYITGNDIMLVDDQPGTTRDPVELKIELNKKPMVLIDTAGLKKNNSSTRIEAIAGIRSKDMIHRADIVVLVVDAAAGITGYDKKIVDMIQSSGKGCVIAMNKWDIVSRENRRGLLKEAAGMFGFVPYIPIIPTSAVTGEGIKKLTDEVIQTSDVYGHRIPTAELNKFFRSVLEEHQPASSDGKLIKLYYLVQIATKPPVFVVFTNSAKGVKDNYSKFIVNRIRDVFGFRGVPVKVIFRGKK
jgi:GTPase